MLQGLRPLRRELLLARHHLHPSRYPAGAAAHLLRRCEGVRRRVLRVEGHEKDAQGREVIVLHCGRNEAQYRVAEVMPTPERAAAIQQQLSELLQTHGS